MFENRVSFPISRTLSDAISLAHRSVLPSVWTALEVGASEYEVMSLFILPSIADMMQRHQSEIARLQDHNKTLRSTVSYLQTQVPQIPTDSLFDFLLD